MIILIETNLVPIGSVGLTMIYSLSIILINIISNKTKQAWLKIHIVAFSLYYSHGYELYFSVKSDH